MLYNIISIYVTRPIQKQGMWAHKLYTFQTLMTHNFFHSDIV